MVISLKFYKVHPRAWYWDIATFYTAGVPYGQLRTYPTRIGLLSGLIGTQEKHCSCATCGNQENHPTGLRREWMKRVLWT
jgi:hypothetical protein